MTRRCLDCGKRIEHSKKARLCPTHARERERERLRRYQVSASRESEASVERLFAKVEASKRKWRAA